MMPWAVFNTNRAKDQEALSLATFLSPATVARLELPREQPKASAPADAAPPDPARNWKPGMPIPPGYHYGKFGLVKLAAPGQRYPSRRPPGVPDDIIERIDAYSTRVNRRVNG